MRNCSKACVRALDTCRAIDASSSLVTSFPLKESMVCQSVCQSDIELLHCSQPASQPASQLARKSTMHTFHQLHCTFLTFPMTQCVSTLTTRETTHQEFNVHVSHHCARTDISVSYYSPNLQLLLGEGSCYLEHDLYCQHFQHHCYCHQSHLLRQQWVHVHTSETFARQHWASAHMGQTFDHLWFDYDRDY